MKNLQHKKELNIPSFEDTLIALGKNLFLPTFNFLYMIAVGIKQKFPYVLGAFFLVGFIALQSGYASIEANFQAQCSAMGKYYSYESATKVGKSTFQVVCSTLNEDATYGDITNGIKKYETYTMNI